MQGRITSDRGSQGRKSEQQLAQQSSGVSLGFVTTVLPPTLGFGFIDEFVLQQFEYLVIAALQFTF
jgi:hypothetical protein